MRPRSSRRASPNPTPSRSRCASPPSSAAPIPDPFVIPASPLRNRVAAGRPPAATPYGRVARPGGRTYREASGGGFTALDVGLEVVEILFEPLFRVGQEPGQRLPALAGGNDPL